MAGTPAQNGNNEAGNNDSSRKTVALVSWNTPRSTDGSNGGPNQANGALACDAAKMNWATPRVGNNNGFGNPDRANDGKSRLEDQVHGTIANGALSHDASGVIATGSPALTANRGQLNPSHSRWLMGYPKEWDRCAESISKKSKGKS
jgi:hypothetical protein